MLPAVKIIHYVESKNSLFSASHAVYVFQSVLLALQILTVVVLLVTCTVMSTIFFIYAILAGPSVGNIDSKCNAHLVRVTHMVLTDVAVLKVYKMSSVFSASYHTMHAIFVHHSVRKVILLCAIYIDT